MPGERIRGFFSLSNCVCFLYLEGLFLITEEKKAKGKYSFCEKGKAIQFVIKASSCYRVNGTELPITSLNLTQSLVLLAGTILSKTNARREGFLLFLTF